MNRQTIYIIKMVDYLDGYSFYKDYDGCYTTLDKADDKLVSMFNKYREFIDCKYDPIRHELSCEKDNWSNTSHHFKRVWSIERRELH